MAGTILSQYNVNNKVNNLSLDLTFKSLKSKITKIN